MEFIDTHAHLDFADFDLDREEVIKRAQEAGVTRIVDLGCNLESSQKVVQIAEKFPGVFAAIGIHPHDAEGCTKKALEDLKKLADNPKVVAIGEVGLDYYRMKSHQDVQQETLRRQLRLAKELNLPVVVHNRDSDEDVIKILEEEKMEKVVIHCFSSNWDLAKRVLDQGYMISFTGVITRSGKETLWEVIGKTSLERIMIETDSPFLVPQKFWGQRNEPMYVVETAKKIAEIKNVSLEEVAKKTTKNAIQFFGLG